MSQLAQDVYDSLCGELLPEYRVPWVENAFREGGFCAEKYAEVYDARLRLGARLGTEEDADVEIIIDSLLAIQRHLCLAMFQYGRQSAG